MQITPNLFYDFKPCHSTINHKFISYLNTCQVVNITSKFRSLKWIERKKRKCRGQVRLIFDTISSNLTTFRKTLIVSLNCEWTRTCKLFCSKQPDWTILMIQVEEKSIKIASFSQHIIIMRCEQNIKRLLTAHPSNILFPN